MLSQPQREHVKLATRTMQIIAAAMAFSVVFFLAIVLFVASQNAGGPAREPFLTYIAAGFALAGIVAWAIVPNAIAAGSRQSIVDGTAALQNTPLHNATELGDVLPLAAAYQTRLILGCALLEGPAFFSVVAYLIERQQLNLVIAGVLFVLLLSQIPTVSRVESWIEGELATIEQLRLMRKP